MVSKDSFWPQWFCSFVVLSSFLHWAATERTESLNPHLLHSTTSPRFPHSRKIKNLQGDLSFVKAEQRKKALKRAIRNIQLTCLRVPGYVTLSYESFVFSLHCNYSLTPALEIMWNKIFPGKIWLQCVFSKISSEMKVQHKPKWWMCFLKKI